MIYASTGGITMDDLNYEIPYVFPACEKQSINNPAVSMRGRCCPSGPAANPYARLYVESQSFENIAKPACALKNGTVFNDLYMPYEPAFCKKGRNVQ